MVGSIRSLRKDLERAPGCDPRPLPRAGCIRQCPRPESPRSSAFPPCRALRRRSLLRQPGPDQGFTHTWRRFEIGREVRVKPRHRELGIQIHRLHQCGLRLRHLVRGGVERRKRSVRQNRAISQVYPYEAFLDCRIVSTQRQGKGALPTLLCQSPRFESRGLILMACSRCDIACS